MPPVLNERTYSSLIRDEIGLNGARLPDLLAFTRGVGRKASGSKGKRSVWIKFIRLGSSIRIVA